jgi:hypothetical protein
MIIREHTVRLDEATYGTLEAEARRRDVAPDLLASQLVREHLGEAGADQRHRVRAALDALGAIRAQVTGPVDAGALVRQGRDELELRTASWPSS